MKAHSTRAHALLSASSSARWLNCTPSARLEDKFEESHGSKTSASAEEGTLAHEISELMLRLRTSQISESTYTKELRKLKKSQYYADEMLDYVEIYVNICMESYEAVKQKSGGEALVSIEERIDFTHIAPEGFGTGDFAVIGGGVLEVIDLKYGRGVEVSAIDNSQLRLYGSGLLRKYELIYDIETVKVTIVQPRLDNYSSEELTVEKLLNWEEVAAKYAQKAYNGEGKQFAGTWCKFCKVKPLCKAFNEQNLELAKDEFIDPYLLDEERLLEIYKVIPMVSDWAKGVADYMLERALDGKEWPGLKVVEGNSRRKYADEKEVLKILKDRKFKPSQYQQIKPIGIPAVEKLLGADFQEVLGSKIIKPQGAPTLVSADDPRPGRGLEQARIDFKD